MRRRQFIGLLGGAVAWPFVARAQRDRAPHIERPGGYRFIHPRRGINVWSGSRAGFYGAEIWGSAAFDSFLGPANRAKLSAAGFDGIRMPGDLSTWAEAGTTGATKIIANYVANLQMLIASGFKTIACLAPNELKGYGDNIFDGVSGAKWSKVRAIWKELAAAIEAVNKPANVAIEPINEPGDKIRNYLALMGALKDDIRAAAPTTTILIPPTSWQSWEDMMQLDGALFTDPNIGCAFHFYPEPYSQQGVGDKKGYHGVYSRIEIPVDVSKRAAQLAALDARMAAAGTDYRNRRRLRRDFETYYTTPRDAAWVDKQMSNINAWAAKRALVGKIICTEWSITGDRSKIDELGADRQSRINGLAMHRAAFEKAGIPWMVNELFGAESKSGQSILSSDKNFTFDDAFCVALIPSRR